MSDQDRRARETYRLDEDLYGLSLHELEQRIAAYQAEIERLQRELAKKGSERSAADRLFGGGS